MNNPLGIIFAVDARRPWLAERSTRSLTRAGARQVVRVVAGELLPSFDGPALLLRAGAWLRDIGPIGPPPPSSSGRPVIALGAAFGGADAAIWRAAMARCGGDFTGEALPPVVCAWVPDARAAAALVSKGFADHAGGYRMVHLSTLDAYDDAALRVVQVVTSLQQGGAERVTWDLHDVLPSCGVASCLVSLGRPLRRLLPRQSGHVDLASIPREERAAAVGRVAARFGADVLHAHLVRGDEMARITAAAGGVPLVVTAHNTRAGWPEGLDRLPPGLATLLVACAGAVDREVSSAGVPAPRRTAWNGIDVGSFAAVERRANRKRLTLACVANPRPQKRLHLLPAVLAEVREALARRGDRREARLIVAGELPPLDEPTTASDCLQELWAAARHCGVADRIEWTNGTRDVRDVLAESDVLVSLSAHEGLSLAHLEALAAGVPVVATDVGGTAEVAHHNPAATLVSADAPASAVALAVLEAADMSTAAAGGRDVVRRHFAREKMAARYAWLYRAAHGPPHGDTLWFVANNLSTGGAQSSLRRLVKALHGRGRRVHVALLQEYPEHPTPGRADLLAAGVAVTVLPPAGTLEVEDAVGQLLHEMCADAPRAVAFWNVIQSYKLLIADALLRVPVFDVSPGEMFYESMDAYFAKPRSGLPYRSTRDYGERLAAVVVKYSAEAAVARERLGAQVHVVPNGIPLAGADAGVARRPVRNDGPLVIGTACRLHTHKRVEDLIDAFRLAVPRLPAAVLRVAGAADAGCEAYEQALRARADGLPVEWLGEVTDVRGFYAGLDVFAMISEPAGCPNASLEAMAAGLPVVATDVGGAGEQVVDGVTGLLVPRRDVHAFAEALVKLGSCAECREAMGSAARARVEARFSLERMVGDYLAILFGAT